jgi:hypothetical protein
MANPIHFTTFLDVMLTFLFLVYGNKMSVTLENLIDNQKILKY